MGSDEVEAHTPPPGELEYLYIALMRVGICQSTQGGFLATSWVEFMNWPRSRGFLVCELEAMRELSEVYASMRNNGADASQPWEAPKC